MCKKILFFVMLITGFMSFLSALNNNAEDMLKKMTPFIGKWKTCSVFVDSGLEVKGNLEYRFVLGGHWIHVEFVGNHPSRPFWQAYVMIKYDEKKQSYVSHAFFSSGDPEMMNGHWISGKTLRFESKNEAMGIDYTINDDGTIYQENWIKPKGGEKKLTLKTSYTKDE